MQSEKEFLGGFEECFGGLEDKRQTNKVDHPLLEILFLSIVAVAGKALRGSARNGLRALHFLNVYEPSSGIRLFGKAIDAKIK